MIANLAGFPANRFNMRRGLSYLEVLIAAGIALTGLLGVIAIFPVAVLNMQKGVVVDVMASAGPAALANIGAYGINDPKQWIFSNGGTPTSVETLSTDPALNYSYRADVQGRRWHNNIGTLESFCFDPRLIAELTSTPAGFVPGTFPYVPIAVATDVRMRRLTLARDQSQPFNKMPLTIQQSRLLFKVQDDLIFNRPEDNMGQLPAQQTYLRNNADLGQRRDYLADYEYVLTAVPSRHLSGTIVGNGFYDMTAVFFHDRQARLETILTTVADEPEAERLVDVVEMPGNGYAGGEVLIQTRTNRPESDLELHEGDYVMLQAMTYSPPGVDYLTVGSYAPTGSLFRWYRVTQVGQSFAAGAAFQRYVTLDNGTDWPVQPPVAGVAYNITPIPSQAAVNAGAVTTRMTIVSGVVGVFHKPNVRLLDK